MADKTLSNFIFFLELLKIYNGASVDSSKLVEGKVILVALFYFWLSTTVMSSLILCSEAYGPDLISLQVVQSISRCDLFMPEA